MKKLLLYIFIILTIPTYSNDYWRRPYPQADSIAFTVKKSSDLYGISQALTTQFKNEEDKYRAIYTWVALNIAYDIKALNNKKLRTTKPEEVVSRGKAVCAGYASLFQNLCLMSKLECEIVNGWAKTEPKDIGFDLNDGRKSQHAWNAIKIKGEWYLCDPTWGAGYVNKDKEKGKIFIQTFKDYYFCTPPELFILKHMPEKRKWKLGASKSKHAFEIQPLFYSNGKSCLIDNIVNKNGVIKFKKGKVIKFEMDVDIPVENITIESHNKKNILNPEFTCENGKLKFKYEMTKSTPYITIYINGNAMLVYKLVR